MLHFQCKRGALHNHKTNKHEKGLKFQTQPNTKLGPLHTHTYTHEGPGRSTQKGKIHTTHTLILPPLSRLLETGKCKYGNI